MSDEDLKLIMNPSNPLPIYLQISYKNNNPCIILRKDTTNPDIFKALLSCAFHERSIIVMPVFSDKLRSVSSLVEKGIIYKKGKEYFFTF